MKNLIFTLVITLSLMSCKAQKVEKEVGFATGKIVQVSGDVCTVKTRDGKILEIMGAMDKGVEYDMLYNITSRGDILKGNLIEAEISERERSVRHAKMIQRMYELNGR